MKIFSFKFILFFLFLTNAIYAKDIPISFDFSAGTSLILGSGFEYVFWKNGAVKSRLNWPLLPAGAFSIKTDIMIDNGIHASFFSSFTIPSYSGTMKDQDYANEYRPDMLTHFSAHNSFLKKGLDLGFNLGWMKPLISDEDYQNKKFKVNMEPSLGVRYIVNSWDAVDGYIQYPDDSLSPVLPDTPIIRVEGLGIRYTQKFLLTSIGIFFKFELPKKWNLNLFTQISPEVIGTGEDFHYNRDLKFLDVFEKHEVSFYLYFSAEKRLSNIFFLFSSIDYTAIIANHGETYTYFLESGILKSGTPMGGSGASLHSFRLNLGFKFHFGK